MINNTGISSDITFNMTCIVYLLPVESSLYLSEWHIPVPTGLLQYMGSYDI